MVLFLHITMSFIVAIGEKGVCKCWQLQLRIMRFSLPHIVHFFVAHVSSTSSENVPSVRGRCMWHLFPAWQKSSKVLSCGDLFANIDMLIQFLWQMLLIGFLTSETDCCNLAFNWCPFVPTCVILFSVATLCFPWGIEVEKQTTQSHTSASWSGCVKAIQRRWTIHWSNVIFLELWKLCVRHAQCFSEQIS